MSNEVEGASFTFGNEKIEMEFVDSLEWNVKRLEDLPSEVEGSYKYM